MTSISKDVYIDKLDDIVNKYNNTYHRTIKMKPVDVKDNAYIDFNKDVNDKNSKFKVGDHARISKYNIFAEGYTPNWSEEVFVFKEVKNTVHGHMLLVILMVKKLLKHFMKKTCKLQKTNQQTFRIEKVIRRKGNKLYVKWKGYDNSFNSWTDQKGVKSNFI